MLYMFHDAGRAYLTRSVFGLRIQYNTLLGVLAMLLHAMIHVSFVHSRGRWRKCVCVREREQPRARRQVGLLLASISKRDREARISGGRCVPYCPVVGWTMPSSPASVAVRVWIFVAAVSLVNGTRVYLSKRSNVPLEDWENSMYFGTIDVGTPPQRLNVLYDTGSSNTWLFGTKCLTQTCLHHHRYDSSASSTYEPDGTNIRVRYGSGSIHSALARDVFSVGNGLSVKQTFGEVFDESGRAFAVSKIDGIVGLAFPVMSPTGANPLFDSMLSSPGLLDSKLFSLYLARGQKDMAQSSILFGGYDTNLFDGPLQYVPLSSESYWELAMHGVYAGNAKLGVCEPGPCKLAIDSGTSMITGPRDSVERLWQRLNVSPDCSNIKTLPSLAFHVGDSLMLTLTPQDYLLQAIDWQGSPPSVKCQLAIMPLDVPPPRGPIWVLGDAFLRAYYTVYDRTNPRQSRVGFAKAKHAHHTMESITQMPVKHRLPSPPPRTVGQSAGTTNPQAIQKLIANIKRRAERRYSQQQSRMVSRGGDQEGMLRLNRGKSGGTFFRL